MDTPCVDDEIVAQYIVDRLEQEGVAANYDFVYRVLELQFEYLIMRGIAFPGEPED